jgi:hypothetical protein
MILTKEDAEETQSFRHGVKNKHGVFCDVQNVFNYFGNHYCFVDVMTYTCGYHHCFETRRLIIGNDKFFGHAKEVRYAYNLHSKLYLCYETIRSRSPIAYVGSLNNRCGGLHDLLVQINDKDQTKKLVEYFEGVWKKSIPHNE